MIIAVDFDGTCVDHRYPDIGTDVPQAALCLRSFVEEGAKLILLTMRDGQELDDAVDWFRDRGIELWGINDNPDQQEWTLSRKVYAHLYIDDAAVGCPLRESFSGGRPMVDWSKVGPMVLQKMGVEV